MVHTTPTPQNSETSEATIRALSSLTRRDANAVRATVRLASSGHSVQEHDDYDGYLSFLITPTDDAMPSYMVAGRTGAVDLAEIRGDDMAPIGTYPSIGAAMIVLRPTLENGRRVEPTSQGWAAILRALDDVSPRS